MAVFAFNVHSYLTVIATLFFTFYQYMIKFYNNIIAFCMYCAIFS